MMEPNFDFENKILMIFLDFMFMSPEIKKPLVQIKFLAKNYHSFMLLLHSAIKV